MTLCAPNLQPKKMAEYQGDETTGFQSPAQDYIEQVIDLAQRLDLRKPNLYPVRVVGQSLKERGIWHGDVLIANAAGQPMHGKVCVAMLADEPILATLLNREGIWWLQPSCKAPFPVSEDIEIWAIIETLVRLRL